MIEVTMTIGVGLALAWPGTCDGVRLSAGELKGAGAGKPTSKDQATELGKLAATSTEWTDDVFETPACRSSARCGLGLARAGRSDRSAQCQVKIALGMLDQSVP